MISVNNNHIFYQRFTHPQKKSSQIGFFLHLGCFKFVIFLPKLLDFEKKKVYTLKVEASNPRVETRFQYLGPFKDSATVRIVVEDVDEPPVFSKLAYVLQIREDAQINTTIGSVTAQDPDASRNPIK